MPKVNTQSDGKWTITLSNFYEGFSPAFWKNSLSSIGNSGQANDMKNINILDPNVLTQGPGLAALTNGTQVGAVTDLVKHILDRAVADNVTYAISETKLHKLSATAVINTGAFPRTITWATDGQSVALLKGNLYYLYNKTSGGDIGRFNLDATFDDGWNSSGVPTGGAALQKAPHPVATKEDIMIFGNGRYVGVFINESNTITVNKLDFGQNNEVADIVFSANNWLIAVNSPNLTGSNRSEGNIFLYDGSATTSLLDDEVGAGLQRIGFLKVIGGIVFVAYQDLSSLGFKIGFVSGRKITPIGSFTGSLPLFYQKTLFENTILFLSGQKIFSNGAVTDDFPIQTSHLATARYATAGAIAAPFGTVLVASKNGANASLDKFNNFTVDANWTSLVHKVSQGRTLSYVDEVTVWTEAFASGGRVDLTLQYNQNSSNSGAKTVSAASKRQHNIKIDKGGIEDLRLFLNFASGSATIPIKIRSIEILGHFTKQ